MVLKIRNWEEFQTYRNDRGAPPWIKVYRSLFTNKKWATLSDAEKGQLVSIWIVAADGGGKIPRDAKILRKIAQLDVEPNISKFIELGLLEPLGCQDDAKLAPNGCQDDAPEESRVEESRVEESRVEESRVEESRKLKRSSKVKLELNPNDPLTADMEAFALSKGVLNPAEEFGRFQDYHLARGSQFKDWGAAWRTWVGNYAKFNGGRNGTYRENNGNESDWNRRTQGLRDFLAESKTASGDIFEGDGNFALPLPKNGNT